MGMVRYWAVVIVGLVSSCRMTFCPARGNFRVRSLVLGSFRFLVIVVNPLSGLLGAATLAHEVEAGVVVASAGVGVPWSWVIAC